MRRVAKGGGLRLPPRSPLLAEGFEREVWIHALQLACGTHETAACIARVSLLPLYIAVEQGVPGMAPMLSREILLDVVLDVEHLAFAQAMDEIQVLAAHPGHDLGISLE